MANYIILFILVVVPSALMMALYPNEPKAFGMGLLMILLSILTAYAIKNYNNPKIKKIINDFF